MDKNFVSGKFFGTKLSSTDSAEYPLVRCMCADTKRVFFKSNMHWRQCVRPFVELISYLIRVEIEDNLGVPDKKKVVVEGLSTRDYCNQWFNGVSGWRHIVLISQMSWILKIVRVLWRGGEMLRHC